ncbi:MAG: hypothetical protein HQL60_03310 [Magnetococcales bacterium]|nr:hypothetical protein [Magnetococcales bacterium]
MPATNRRYTVLWVVIVVALLLAFGMVERLLVGRQAGQRVVAIFEQLLGQPLQVGEVTFFPLGGLAIKLHSVSLLAGGSNRDRPLLRIDEIIVGLSPEFLFHGTPRFSSITLVEPRLYLYQQSTIPWQTELFALFEQLRLRGETGQLVATVNSPIGMMGRLTVRNGLLLTVAPGRPSDGEILMDRLQASLLDFSQTHPTPVRLSGRLKSVPFTLDGQLGPLPAAGEWLSLPMLMNIDMKAVGTTTLAPFLAALRFSEWWPDLRASRAQLSVTLRGNIRHGMQSRAELQLVIAASESVPPPLRHIALQQKSLLRLDVNDEMEFVPLLLLQEGKIQLNNLPWVELKGSVQWWQRRPHFSLTVATARAIDMTLVADLMRKYPVLPVEWPLPSGRMEGQWLLLGSWPGALNFFSHLDLSATTLSWPPFHKKTGVPLVLEVRGSYADQELHLQQVVLSATAGNRLEWFGRLSPDPALTMVGQLEGETLKEYLPLLNHWSLRGESRVQLAWSHHPDQATVEMWFNSQRLHLGGVDIRDGAAQVRWYGNRIFIPRAHFRLGEGWVDLSGMVYGQAPTWGYDVMVSFLDVETAALPETPLQSLLVDRLLSPLAVGQTNVALPIESARCSGHGTFRGWLTTDGIEKPVAGRAHLEFSAGRLLGVMIPQWSERPVELDGQQEVVRMELLDDSYGSWERASVDVTLDQERLLFRDLLLRSGDTVVRGAGRHDDRGAVEDRLFISSPWWRDPRPMQLRLNGDKDQLTALWQSALPPDAPLCNDP